MLWTLREVDSPCMEELRQAQIVKSTQVVTAWTRLEGVLVLIVVEVPVEGCISDMVVDVKGQGRTLEVSME